MTGNYECLLGLEPWLWGLLHKKDVAGYLSSLEDNSQGGGGGKADVTAEAFEWVMEKALRVAREIESGRLQPPNKPEKYFKKVMQTALVDWFRTHPKAVAVGLSSNERAELDGGLLSVDKGNGEPSFWPTVRVRPMPPERPRFPTRDHLPLLLRLVKPPRRADPAELARVQGLLAAIPSESRREIVLLNLEGYRQRQIAEATLRTQQSVSKALRRQYKEWGWDDGQVRRIQRLMASDNLSDLFLRVFPPKALKSLEEEFGSARWEEERRSWWQRLDELLHVRRGPFELPRDDEAYSRARNALYLPVDEEPQRQRAGGTALDRTSEENGIVDHASEGLEEGRKERGQRKLNRLKREETRLYQAIMNEPSLAPWRKDVKPFHMPQLFDSLMRGDYEYDYEESAWLRL